MNSDRWTEEDSLWMKMYLDDHGLSEIQDLASAAYDTDLSSTQQQLHPSAATAVLRKIHLNIAPADRTSYTLFSFRKIAVAAVLLIAISAVWYTYFHNREVVLAEGVTLSLSAGNDIEPGTNKALLTLSDGSTITLDNASTGFINREQQTEITKTAAGELIYTASGKRSLPSKAAYNTIATPRGGQYQLRLPDGSKVWLNASSTLKFPVSFENNNNRQVQLNGEAYFEIARDPKHPFRVVSGQQTVEVLGTHFNVNAYDQDAASRTTLLEGSVKILSKQQFILKPGQQATTISGSTKVSEADVQAAMAWKNALFIFDYNNLEDILKTVSRWYDVDIVYLNAEAKQELFSGRISRFENVSEVLKKLALTGAVKFKIEGRRILVMK